MTARVRAAATTLLRGRSHARVLAAMGPQQPDQLLRALVLEARARDVGLTLLLADLDSAWSFLDDGAAEDVAGGRLRLVTLAGGVPRRWASSADHIPLTLWDAERAIATRALPIDVFVAAVVEGAQPGTVELGDMVGYTPAGIEQAAAVGFELRAGRRFASAPAVALDRADAVVETSRTPPPRRPQVSPDGTPDIVGRRVAQCVPDGATLQLGLGAVPAAVAGHLGAKHDLGLHSGILSTPTKRLIDSGVVTGRRKSVDPGLHVATGVLDGATGAEATWSSALRLEPISRTHAPDRLLRQERLWAVNSAFEVDLTGQPNAEYAGGLRVASAGGQADFVRAAHASNGGAAVLALPARTRSGVSRIVARLAPPALPAALGGDIDVVVTEYGVARLTGRSAAERAQALIAVAHPDDREALRRALADEPVADQPG